MKITHDKYRLKRVQEEAEEFRKSFNTAASTMPELKPHISKAQDDLNPLRVLRLFQRITPEVKKYMHLYFLWKGEMLFYISRKMAFINK